MKKQFYLTLLLALFSAATVWAKFAPEEGKMYALKETTSGLYLDIQTGVLDGNKYYDDNLSLSENPCVIYFAKGTTNNAKWTMKNANGEYVMQDGTRLWIVRLGETAYEWTIAEPESGKFTIARADGKFIGVDNPTAGSCLYCNIGTGLKFELMEVSYSYELGDIQSSADLMAVTTATHIAIKNCADNNQYYLAGTSNKENWESAILVWEPVTDGTPGTYYLRTTDATTGYIQSAATGTNVSLGTKTGAQVFYTTEPTGSGSGPTLCNAIGDLSGADTDNLVRFVQNGNEVWLNCQASGGSPKYTGTANSAYGVWTVHNVYAVNVTETLSKVISNDTSIGITGTYVLKTTGDTYLGADCTFSSSSVNLSLTPHEGGYWVIEDAANAGTYIGVGDASVAVTTDTEYKWAIGAADTKGYAPIMRADDNTKFLGNTATTAGTDVLTDVTANYNTWYFTGTYNVATAGTASNNKYTFTSNKIYYAGACNKLRFTLTQSAATYKSGAKRLSLDSFVLYDANGNTIDITTDDITGNNITDFSGMLSGADGSYSAGTYDDSASPVSDDYFEITLDEDFGGAFSFSFVTENTTMNAQAFEIVTSWQEPADYRFAIEGAPNNVTVSATYDGTAIADGSVIPYSYDAALFVFGDIEGYSYELVVDKEARTITLVYEKKYNWSVVGLPDGAAVTYNSAAVADGGIVGVDYDSQYLAVTCPNGYTWAVTRDNENKIITITFAQLQSEVNPQSVVALINRIGGAGTDAKFKFVLDPSLNYTADQFSINGEEGKVLIKGTTISAITTGIGWYLQNYAHINIAWNSLNEKTVSGEAYADLSKIPVPTSEETRTSDAMYRYYLNTCAFGYSMTSWTWERWQQEIDWMALHGINMPLQLVGLEEVWRSFLTMEENGKRKYGYTDAEAKAFVAGPAFIAWWAMNNLEGWGGTAAGTKSGYTNLAGAGGVQDDAWYARQKKLANDIVTRQRELGMQPVIPGWSGMVPTNFASKSGYATRGNGGNWAGDFVRPLLLNVSNANYAEIAADYYTCLHEVMGESQYYSMDPFHEGGGAGTMEDYTAMYNAMETAMPGSKWVIQQWQWTATQRYSLTAVPAGRLVVLDLFADGKPAFDSYNGFAPQDAVFCAIPNFGGRSGLMGRLTNLTDNYFKFKEKYATIKGIGAAPEAIEQTPVTYDLIFQLPWMGSKPDVAEWVDNYAISRYGQDNEEIKEAWSLLRQSVFNYGADGIEGPIEDVWASRPNLEANYASSWGSTISKSSKGVNVAATYTKARRQMLIDATYKLLNQNNAISGDIYLSNYYYDLVEMGGGVLADYAHDLLLAIGAAKTAAGANFATDATYIARRDAFLQLILDVDAFKGTNLNFRLGKWTQEARDAAGEVVGATTATPDWYEYNNARTIVSTWSSPGTNLNDYSYRSWQGLMKDLYYPRWKHYFDNNCTSANYNFFAWNWAHGMEHNVGQTAISSTPLTSEQAGHTSKYTREPEGNTVEVATEVLGKYIIPIKADDGAYYAYCYLTETNNDFTDAVITVLEGAKVDLNDYFGDLTSGGTITVTIAGDAFDSTTDYTAVTIKSDAAGGADYATSIATISLSDGTVFTVTIKAMTTAYKDAREALATLIEQMEPLVPQAGTYNTAGVTTDLPLTTTADSDYYIWTNADHNDYNNTPDGGGIDALIDNKKETFLHTNWGDVTGIDEAHFIEVKLGDANALQQFKFDYTTRHNGENNWITQLKITGSNDGVNYDFIETVTGLPTSAGLTYDSPVFTTAKKYSILRFTIVATNTNKKDNGGDFIFSHMAEFNLYKAETTADVLDKYDGTELTDAFAAECYDVLQNAKLVYESGTAAEIEAAATALKAAYDKLLPLLTVDDYPFTLTTDEENPVLYNIYIKRTADVTVLQYDEASKKIAVTDKAANNSYQAWYFTQGTADGQVFVHPYNADGNVIGATNTGNGAGKVSAAGKDAQEYDEWVIVARGDDGYYNINATNGAYFSNFGGTDSKMGFWDGDANESKTQTDDGSLFKFIPATFDDENPRFYQMKDLNAQLNRYIAGTSVGFYTEASVAAINEKQAAATALETAGSASSSAADCYAAYKAMREAEDNVEYIEPDPAKAYYIVSTSTKDYCAGHYVHTLCEPDGNYNHNHLRFHAYGNIGIKSLAAFQFEKTGVVGEYKMKNLHTGLYVKSFAGTHMGTEAEAQAVKISALTAGQLTLKIGNNNPMHAQDSNDEIVQWGAEKDNASTWIINEINDITQLNYTVEVPGGITTLDLAFNVVLPDGLTAYTVDPARIKTKADGITYYYEELTQVAAAGEKLAKGTAVIIRGAAGSYTLEATLDDADAKAPAASALVGTYYQTTTSTGYSLAIENSEPIFNAITAETAILHNACWLVADDITTDKIGLTTDFLPAEIEDGKVYRIKGRLSDGTYRLLYTNGGNSTIKWTADLTKDDASTLFIAQEGEDGKFKLVSALANGYWSQDAKIEEEGVELTFANGSVNRTAMILGDNARRFCVDENGNLNFYSNVAGESANTYVKDNSTTDFAFEEVQASAVSYALKMSSNNKWATLYLPFAVTIPNDLVAYIPYEADVDTKTVTLHEVSDVIPAATPVVIGRNEAVAASATTTVSYNFDYTTTQATVETQYIDDNLLSGRFIKAAVAEDGKNCYVILTMSKEAFYWIYKEYNANSQYVGNDGTHIICSANRAYMALDASQNNAASYSFVFEGTTGIDGVEAEGNEVDAIYDLQGRKLEAAPEKGIYIVNGELIVK